MRRLPLLGLLLVGVASTALAESPCSDPEKSSQFDFWVGEWDVFAGDKHVGVNSIRPILDGCVLQESWQGDGGSAGSSFNFYNPSTGRWEQFWVWRNGTTLHLYGGYADGQMVLEGRSTGPDGDSLLNRIRWYDNEDGTVRQHWQTSSDDGQSWKTVFDGLYRKKP